jgi:hypothetical protein
MTMAVAAGNLNGAPNTLTDVPAFIDTVPSPVLVKATVVESPLANHPLPEGSELPSLKTMPASETVVAII